MPARDAEEEFEFLVDLLASDGVEPEPSLGAAGSRKSDSAAFGIQRGSDGKLDLGQVKAFYEKKNMGGGRGTEKAGGIGLTDGLGRSTDYPPNHSEGLSWFRACLVLCCGRPGSCRGA